MNYTREVRDSIGSFVGNPLIAFALNCSPHVLKQIKETHLLKFVNEVQVMLSYIQDDDVTDVPVQFKIESMSIFIFKVYPQRGLKVAVSYTFEDLIYSDSDSDYDSAYESSDDSIGKGLGQQCDKMLTSIDRHADHVTDQLRAFFKGEGIDTSVEENSIDSTSFNLMIYYKYPTEHMKSSSK